MCKVECRWDPGCISSRHPASNLLAELSDVATGRLQVFEQHGEVGLLLTGVQERTQTTNLHSHAVQGTLGKLHVTQQVAITQCGYISLATRNYVTLIINTRQLSSSCAGKKCDFSQAIVGTHSDVISQLHGAFLVLLCQMDTVQVLEEEMYM